MILLMSLLFLLWICDAMPFNNGGWNTHSFYSQMPPPMFSSNNPYQNGNGYNNNYNPSPYSQGGFNPGYNGIPNQQFPMNPNIGFNNGQNMNPNVPPMSPNMGFNNGMNGGNPNMPPMSPNLPNGRPDGPMNPMNPNLPPNGPGSMNPNITPNGPGSMNPNMPPPGSMNPNMPPSGSGPMNPNIPPNPMDPNAPPMNPNGAPPMGPNNNAPPFTPNENQEIQQGGGLSEPIIILLSVLGSLLAIAIIILSLIFCCKKERKKASSTTKKSHLFADERTTKVQSLDLETGGKTVLNSLPSLNRPSNNDYSYAAMTGAVIAGGLASASPSSPPTKDISKGYYANVNDPFDDKLSIDEPDLVGKESRFQVVPPMTEIKNAAPIPIVSSYDQDTAVMVTETTSVLHNNALVQEPRKGLDEEETIDFGEWVAPAPTSHVVIRPYYPNRRDELKVSIGDLIGIEKEYEDGWCLAQNVTQGRRGMLPLAILTPIKSGPSQTVSNVGGRIWQSKKADSSSDDDTPTVSNRDSSLKYKDITIKENQLGSPKKQVAFDLS